MKDMSFEHRAGGHVVNGAGEKRLVVLYSRERKKGKKTGEEGLRRAHLGSLNLGDAVIAELFSPGPGILSPGPAERVHRSGEELLARR